MQKTGALVALLFAWVMNANALNIVVTNDDSFGTSNVQSLRQALLNAGHHVLVSVPCAHQSGKGGSLGSILKPMPVRKLRADANGALLIDDTVDEPAGYCVGDTEQEKATKTYEEFRDGTPLQASAHGLYLAENVWGAAPDLLISGPNEGNNVGFAVFISGTLGATHFAIFNGVPAIALSAGQTPKNDQDAKAHADMVADVAVRVVDALVQKRVDSSPLLPPLSGLNINTPNYDRLKGAQFKQTQVNWHFGAAIKWSNLGAEGGAGSHYGYSVERELYGLNIFGKIDPAGDDDPNSEGKAVDQGFIAISVIDATENASQSTFDKVIPLIRNIIDGQ